MIINQASSIITAENQRLNHTAPRDSASMPKAAIPDTPAGLAGSADRLEISSQNATIRENLNASNPQRQAAEMAGGLLEALKGQIGEQGGSALDAQTSGINSSLMRLLEE